jgi:hypothetical protein
MVQAVLQMLQPGFDALILLFCSGLLTSVLINWMRDFSAWSTAERCRTR